jgi:protoheme IX farnesyltransferase
LSGADTVPGPVAGALALTKPRITILVTFTTWVGGTMAARDELPAALWAATIVGTAFVAGGASALNMLMERRSDSLMRRTRNRPLPSGSLGVLAALALGTLLTAAGLACLLLGAGPRPAAVALISWATYLFVYTPLKARTSFATVIGAVPGALPPVIGWTAAGGEIDASAFALFAILFLWQIPHFLAIAWLYREDYSRAGLPLLPVIDLEGGITGRQAVVHTVALAAVSAVPAAVGMSGAFYLVGSVLLGLAFLAFAVRAAALRTARAARGLFLASLVYLPALLGLLVLDRA